MTPLRIATVALGAAAGVTVSAALGAGVLSNGAGVVQRLTVGTPAAAGELPAFEDCEQLRRWYVDAALERVGPYGLDAIVEMAAGTSMATVPDGAVAARGDAVTSSGTGTNVQEPDVDESDVAKTDGDLVFRMVRGRLVVTDVSGDRARELARTTLPGPGLTSAELVLDGDRVMVAGDQGSLPYIGLDATSPGRVIAPGHANPMTRIVSVDVSDPGAPRVTRTRSIRGSVVSTRQHADGTVRVVVDNGRPDLDLVMPGRGRTAKQATAANREVVRSAPLSAWLPAVTSSVSSESGPVDCSDVRHPRSGSGLGTVTVLSMDGDDELDSTSVTAPGNLVYSSASRLYVATTGLRSTTVHAFRLDPGRASYVGSGTVAGTVRDRWSFSEYDGHLRVATALVDDERGDPWQPRENAVVVLAERRGTLVPTGRVDGLGKGEQIKSVRWLGERAVVVTFRQTDPLYTLDLSDPDRPRVEGELKIPGYSAYLHPVGDDLLLGLGQHATASGSDLGSQAATFDLRDRTDVRRLDTSGFGSGSTLGVEWDPRAFTYLPDRRTFVTRVDSWPTDVPRSWFQAVRVSANGTLTQVGSWTARPRGDLRTLPLSPGRVALVDDDRVRVVHVG